MPTARSSDPPMAARRQADQPVDCARQRVPAGSCRPGQPSQRPPAASAGHHKRRRKAHHQRGQKQLQRRPLTVDTRSAPRRAACKAAASGTEKRQTTPCQLNPVWQHISPLRPSAAASSSLGEILVGRQQPEHHGRDRLHHRIADRNRIAAMPASAPPHDPAEDRHVVEPADRLLAFRAVRRRMDQADPQRQPVHHHVQETADHRPDHGQPDDDQPVAGSSMMSRCDVAMARRCSLAFGSRLTVVIAVLSVLVSQMIPCSGPPGAAKHPRAA